jgi:hypothetical protein
VSSQLTVRVFGRVAAKLRGKSGVGAESRGSAGVGGAGVGLVLAREAWCG